MPAAAVATYLGNSVGQQFLWEASKTRLLNDCLSAPPVARPAYSLSCYELPFYAARQTGVTDLACDAVAQGLFALMQGRPVPATAFVGGLRSYNNYGLWQYIWWQNLPLAGDFVFFSGPGAKYMAHVAIATGVGYDTVSFGHNGLGGGGAQALQVANLTVAQIFALNPQLTSAHFFTPTW
ncbi:MULTISPECIES: hypothetical protein [unclassified Pseudomonas]|uniref:hypothetical protein n=1 Tax=unclassified Pseudomonas TaxID=196821 RepID=UPI00117A41AD|nr:MULTISPECIES: hypothetical protein [unclassified Pseudomonas]MCU1721823.1 hypothetical protein [Pseudomonas sp. 5P_5.1_Bac1]MCU1732890.1 hypothetical protein [Pseudomonas sp. 20P_3.2_Bac4]MCU1742444.1 hypothetical protein [Pseudomonas sp. 20P_3.2_Bac5]